MKTGLGLAGRNNTGENLVRLRADATGERQLGISHGDLKLDLLVLDVEVHRRVRVRLARVLLLPGELLRHLHAVHDLPKGRGILGRITIHFDVQADFVGNIDVVGQ